MACRECIPRDEMKWTARQQINAGFTLALCLLAVIGVRVYLRNNYSLETNRTVADTREVLTALYSLEARILSAESAVHGYVASRRETFLEPTAAGYSAISLELSRLKSLTADNRSQQERLQKLAPLMARKISILQQLVDRRRKENTIGPQSILLLEEGRLVGNEIRILLDTMITEENGLLHRRIDDYDRSSRSSRAIIFVGTFSSVIIILLALLMVNREFNARNRVERSLRQSEERFAKAFRASPLAMSISRLDDGRFLDANDSLLRLIGYSRDEVIGRSSVELNIFPDPGQRAAAADQLRQRNKIENLEQSFRRRNGEIRQALVSSELVKLENVICILTLAVDITERKQFEIQLQEARDAALESSRLKSQFLANMSHEIRTPMNGVIGMSTLLLGTPLNDTQRDYAETIRSSGESLLAIINDILDFSRIEAGKLVFETIDFDLAATVEGAIDLHAEAAASKKIDLAYFIDPGTPLALRGDPGRLRQVITNLLSNAVKFTDRGEVILRVTAESDDAEAAVIKFTIRDTGIGIRPEKTGKLFQSFTQADASTTRRFGGTGLGLAISRQLTELLGGTIGLSSLPDEGSIFWFTARFGKSPVPAPGLDPSPSRLISGLRILIIEKNNGTRSVLTDQLRAWNLDVETAVTATESFERLRAAASIEKAFTFVVVGQHLDDAEGLDLARAILAEKYPGSMRLVLLPAPGEKVKEYLWQSACFAASLERPIKPANLLECLMNLSDLKREGGLDRNSPSPGPPTSTSEDSRPLRILLAEDNIVNQKVAARQLQSLGHSVDTAANGLEVLEAIGRVPYDIIFMDCQMPEMDGFEATFRIRLRENSSDEGHHIPIIALTANAMEGDREKCLAAGMDDYISKPVRLEELKARLRNIRPGSPAAPVLETLAGILDPTVWQSLQQLANGSSDFLRQLMETFLTDAEQSLLSMREASAEKNVAALEKLVHRLKGSAGNIGATKIASLCRELESRPTEHSQSKWNESFDLIEKDLILLRKGLENEIWKN